MRTKHTRRCLAAVLAAVLLLGAAAGAFFWNRHRGAAPAVVETAQENAAEQVVFFRQKDDRWKTDTLGDSVYHMADSGCLTCCVAAALQMQQISSTTHGAMSPAVWSRLKATSPAPTASARGRC